MTARPQASAFFVFSCEGFLWALSRRPLKTPFEKERWVKAPSSSRPRVIYHLAKRLGCVERRKIESMAFPLAPPMGSDKALGVWCHKMEKAIAQGRTVSLWRKAHPCLSPQTFKKALEPLQRRGFGTSLQHNRNGASFSLRIVGMGGEEVVLEGALRGPQTPERLYRASEVVTPLALSDSSVTFTPCRHQLYRRGT